MVAGSGRPASTPSPLPGPGPGGASHGDDAGLDGGGAFGSAAGAPRAPRVCALEPRAPAVPCGVLHSGRLACARTGVMTRTLMWLAVAALLAQCLAGARADGDLDPAGAAGALEQQEPLAALEPDSSGLSSGREAHDGHGHYSSQWAVHIVGGPEMAQDVADRHDFDNLGQVSFSCWRLCETSANRCKCQLICVGMNLEF